MSDREKARDLGNQSAALARSIADVLNDTLDALETAENTGRGLESSYDRLAAERDEALRQASEAERDRYWNDAKDQVARAEAAEARVEALEAGLGVTDEITDGLVAERNEARRLYDVAMRDHVTLIHQCEAAEAERDRLREALGEMGVDMSAWDAAALGEDA
jgi:hypothetical protein